MDKWPDGEAARHSRSSDDKHGDGMRKFLEIKTNLSKHASLRDSVAAEAGGGSSGGEISFTISPASTCRARLGLCETNDQRVILGRGCSALDGDFLLNYCRDLFVPLSTGFFLSCC